MNPLALDTAAATLDADADGWTAASAGGPDCDDGDPAVHPEAEELCGNAVDDDCDGVTDPDCPVDGAVPVDPGGYAWVCGTSLPLAGPGLLLALAFVAWRRAWR